MRQEGRRDASVVPVTRGPMAKHASARQRSNTVSTAREIVLRGEHEALLPVPPLPDRHKIVEGQSVEVQWHRQATTAWAEMWQFPLVYQAPEVDRHLMYVYIALLDAFWRRMDEGRAVTELAKEIRPYSEMWGFGEKARRHLQITIQEAEEAMERGRKRETVQIGVQEPSASAFTPNWTDQDEDDGSILDAEVVS